MFGIVRIGLLTSAFYLVGCVITGLVALVLWHGRLVVLTRWPAFVWFGCVWFISYYTALRVVWRWTKASLAGHNLR
jgi:hypothetical protein